MGLANLRRLISDPMALRVMTTTLLYLIGVVPPIVLGSLALAVLVNRSLPGIHVLRGAFYTPVLVSIVVAAIAFRWLYAENGLVNGWLVAWFGDTFSPIGFLTTPQLALPAVVAFGEGGGKTALARRLAATLGYRTDQVPRHARGP